MGHGSHDGLPVGGDQAEEAREPKLAEASWDSAAQLYLGLFALEQSGGNAAVSTALRDLSQQQAFPPAHDSPSDPRSQKFQAALRKVLEQIRP